MKSTNSAKHFTFIGVGRIVGAGLHGIFYLLFASVLNPTLFGELIFLIVLAETFSIVSRFGLNHTVTIFQAKNDNLMVQQVNLIAFLSTSVAAVILIPINLFVAILTLSISFFIMSQHNLLGKKKFKKFMFISLLQGSLLLTITIFMYFLLDINGILIGMLISNFVCSLAYWRSLSRITLSFNKIKKNLKVLIHNFGIDLSTNLSRRIDKLLIVPILGFTAVGIFQFNTQILFGLELIPLSLHSFLLAEESSGVKHKKLIYLIILLSIGITISLLIFAPLFVNQFFPDYSSGIFSLQILSLALVPLTISAVYSAKLQSIKSTKVGFAAIIRIGSLILFIPTLGYWLEMVGLSIAILISAISYVIFLVIIYHKSSVK